MVSLAVIVLARDDTVESESPRLAQVSAPGSARRVRYSSVRMSVPRDTTARRIYEEFEEWERSGMPSSPLRMAARPLLTSPKGGGGGESIEESGKSKRTGTKSPGRGPQKSQAPAARDIIAITNQLLAKVRRSPSFKNSESARGIIPHLKLLLQHFRQLSQVSLRQEKRLRQVTAYAKRLERKDALRDHQKTTDAASKTNEVIVRELAGKCSDLMERVKCGEDMLVSLHAGMKKMAEKLQEEHQLRCAAEDRAEMLSQQLRSGGRRRRVSSVSKRDHAYSADEADDGDDQNQHQQSRHTRTHTPLGIYDGAFKSMEHFDTYLSKLRQRREIRHVQRKVARYTKSAEPTAVQKIEVGQVNTEASRIQNTVPIDEIESRYRNADGESEGSGGIVRDGAASGSDFPGLDYLEDLRALSEHSAGLLDRMGQIGSDDQRRAQIDAHNLAGHVDVLADLHDKLLRQNTITDR